MKKGDILLIIAALVFLVLWLIPKAQGGVVRISVNGEIYKEVPLCEDNEIIVKSNFGENTVIVKQGEVYITDTDCPGKLCEKERISKSGQSIVCLPNRLSVTIEGKNTDEEIDVIV